MGHWIGDIFVDDSNQGWDTKLVPESPGKWMALPVKVDIAKIDPKDDVFKAPRTERIKKLTTKKVRKQRMLITVKPMRGRPPEVKENSHE